MREESQEILIQIKKDIIEGNHYFYLERSSLNEFLQYGNSGVQNLNKVRSLYLWTQKGILSNAESLNTDKCIIDLFCQRKYNLNISCF